MTSEKFGGTLADLQECDNSAFVNNSTKTVIFGPDHFWEDYVMRCFRLQPRAAGSKHIHPWPHRIFVHSGEGVFEIDGTEYAMSPGSWIYVPSNVPHSFWNSSDEKELVFLCIVPPEGDVNPLDLQNRPN